MKAYIETYGCTLNHADSITIQAILEDNFFLLVDDEKDADVIVLNTCVVRKETEDRMKQRIRDLSMTGKKLIVTGCMASSMPRTISTLSPNASIISPQSIIRFSEVLASPSKKVILEPGEPFLPERRGTGIISIIPIQDGCASNCSFCETKLARQVLRSYPLDDIVSTSRRAIENGAKEIELTGQDTATYGLDRKDNFSLPDVVRSILSIPGDYRIRIGMMNPRHALRISRGLIDVLREDRVYKFLHIPVQSGSDNVLKVMNRDYNISEFLTLVRMMRENIAEINITTDIIVGHPGEEEYDFEKTLKLMENVRFERIHIAMYSIRPNTASSRLPQIPDSVKKERASRANRLYEDIASDIHSKYLGKEVEVLVTETGRRGTPIGRTNNYIPVVIEGEVKMGERVHVLVDDFTFYDLRGKPI